MGKQGINFDKLKKYVERNSGKKGKTEEFFLNFCVLRP